MIVSHYLFKEEIKEMKKIWDFLKDEDGLELSEYAVMGALIIVGLTVAISALGTQIGATFGRIQTEITPP